MGSHKRSVLKLSRFNETFFPGLKMLRNLVLISLALCLSCDILVLAARQKQELIFNGDGKVFLALSKNFKVDTVLENGKKVKFDLPEANQATVTGTKSGSDFSLDISYDKEIEGDGGAKLTKAQLKFDINYGVSGYWTLKGLTATYKVSDAGKIIDIQSEMDVSSNPGATKQPADAICGRGHLTCAPKNLCWACDNQVFKDTKGTGDKTSRLTMPGARLQPVISNTTINGYPAFTESASFRFGYEWDCDPLIPLSVWVGLLLTLILASFIYWAIGMVTSIATPDRFDDPKGKPLNVPSKE